MPAYNAEATVGQAVSSVLAQSFSKFELIVVNDGSSDRTVKIVQDLSATDPRITLVSQNNRGVAAARNFGISLARAELIAPLDADDLWHPTYLEKQVATINQRKDTAAVYAWSRYIDADGDIIWTPHYPDVYGRVFNRQLYWNMVGNGSALMFKKSVALEFGGYDARVVPTEDFMLQLKIASRYHYGVTREYLVGYRHHAGQESKNADRSYRSCIRTLGYVREECQPVPERAVGWKLGELHFAGAARAYAHRQFGQAIRLLSLAARSDLAGAAFMLAVFGKQRARHFAGRLKRALVPIHATGKRYPFLQARPDELVLPNNSGQRARRLEYLRRLDEMSDNPV
jgi:glycosyltransferase involved in cell wall biosynthesis